jgi:hypothetical protein
MRCGWHAKCLTPDREPQRVPRSKAVGFKSNVAVPRVSLDSRVPFRGLAPVGSRKPNAPDTNAPPSGPLFSTAETRHNFTIWALEKSGTSRGRFHLYYCVRCKWVFLVDDYSVSVTPLDQDGNLLRAPEAGKRLATFSVGPCPVFSEAVANARLTQPVTRSDVPRGRLAAVFHAMSHIWKRFKSRRETTSLA